MHRSSLILAICALGATAPSFAQVQYKTPDGRTVYTDQMPPPGARAVTPLDARSSREGPATADLPYELRRAAQSFPVTLYTIAGCAACDAGRALLRERGVPYAERTISTSEDQTAFRQRGLPNTFPVMTVGATRVAEFQPERWNEALTIAGYPARSQLPPGYAHAPGRPLASGAPAAAPASQAEVSAPAPAPAPAPAAPPGFRF